MDLEQIEKLLLHGAHFTTEQKQVIQAPGRINVVAGPGSGKTTVLAAKVLLLLTNPQIDGKGICCITHTNVAVNEILERLKIGGIDEVEYPNFVGTIQSFMDTFLGRTAFAKILPGVTMKLLEEEKYKERYTQNFKRIVTTYTYPKVPNPDKWQTKLVISDSGLYHYENVSQNFQYGINHALKWLFNDGIVSYNDLKSLSNWYLNQHKAELCAALGERFSYLMLDEAQDTDMMQFNIINNLASASSLNVQRFGDPYQSLYTIYGSEVEDSWKPKNDEGVYATKEISETTRFGSVIAGVVKNVCIEEYSHFHSNQQFHSFPKYFLTYATGDELRKKHDRLIESAANSDTNFRDSDRVDAIVGVMHDDVYRVESEYVRESTKQRGHRRAVKEIYDLLVTLLANTMNHSVVEEQQIVRSDGNLNQGLADIIQRLADKQLTCEELYDSLNKFIAIDSSIVDSFKSDCEHLIRSVNSLSNQPEITEKTPSIVHREFSTIHGVKGETHRSTVLLLDSCVHPKYGLDEHENEFNKFFEVIFPYLLGHRTKFSENAEVRKLQRDSLKLAYVALSRPKYLVAVAIPIKDLGDKKREELLSHGWVEAK
ncbi:UvrD-helicase domain-containing protein [Lacticaseibacillus sp. N501-2]|uniref:UvrD-helicase domain-containing protein n=1 Tax=Lacticaseibacillus salsurae TaxID=3367729 RepID=UPI0038B24367